MKISDFYYCRECRVSHHRAIKDLKNSFIEKPSNLRDLSKVDMSILEDYVNKNVKKKTNPFHFTVEDGYREN